MPFIDEYRHLFISHSQCEYFRTGNHTRRTMFSSTQRRMLIKYSRGEKIESKIRPIFSRFVAMCNSQNGFYSCQTCRKVLKIVRFIYFCETFFPIVFFDAQHDLRANDKFSAFRHTAKWIEIIKHLRSHQTNCMATKLLLKNLVFEHVLWIIQ